MSLCLPEQGGENWEGWLDREKASGAAACMPGHWPGMDIGQVLWDK